MGSRVDSAVIRGMGKREDQFIMILDLDKVFTASELRSSSTIAPDAPAVTTGPAA
jgi:purine-binding chemotaxis protein CheW